MKIDLFAIACERIRVDKTTFLNNRFTIEGSLRSTTSIIDPVILIEKTNPSLYNYMYISEFSRFYFINNIKNVKTNLWEIFAHVDVLYTFRADIGNSLGLVTKTEDSNLANLYIDDGSFVTDNRTYNTIKYFPNGLNNNGEYVLIAAGGFYNE